MSAPGQSATLPLWQARAGQPADARGKILPGDVARLGVLLELGAEQTWQYLCPVCLIPEAFRGYSQEQARRIVLPKHKACEGRVSTEATPTPARSAPGDRPRYSLGAHSFSSKAAIGSRCKELLHRRLGRIVAPDEEAFLRDLVAMHPQASAKIGCGVAGFEVWLSSYGTPRFVLIRTDGSRADFSYKVCLEPWRSSPETCAKAALRVEVEDQILRFLRDERQRGPLVDAVTGRPICNEKPHVDHASPTFAELVGMWLAAEGISLSQLATDGHGDLEDRLTLRDRDLARRWQRFHADNARLRVVTESTNQALHRERLREMGS